MKPFYIDVDSLQLVRNTGRLNEHPFRTFAMPDLEWNSSTPFELHWLREIDDGWKPIVADGKTVTLAIKAPFLPFTRGATTITFEGVSTEALDVHETNLCQLQEALNDLSSIEDAGYVYVEPLRTGPNTLKAHSLPIGEGFLIRFVNNGARTAFTSAITGAWFPESGFDIVEVTAGDTNTPALISFTPRPMGEIASGSLTNALPAPSGTITTIAAGDGTTKAEFSVNIANDPYARDDWQLSVGDESTGWLPANASAEDVAKALNTLYDAPTGSIPDQEDFVGDTVALNLSDFFTEGVTGFVVTKTNKHTWRYQWPVTGAKAAPTLEVRLREGTRVSGSLTWNADRVQYLQQLDHFNHASPATLQAELEIRDDSNNLLKEHRTTVRVSS